MAVAQHTPEQPFQAAESNSHQPQWTPDKSVPGASGDRSVTEPVQVGHRLARGGMSVTEPLQLLKASHCSAEKDVHQQTGNLHEEK